MSAAHSGAAGSPQHPTNRLINERSPYLLQHARNPVDWYAWGPEALERAKTEDRPIFLSVGYSACHWCHVMERESFEDAAIAALLNDRFVPIKVDREERPDIDDVYMTAVQMMTGHGGWPMSVFLTPDGRPFYAGTYFPPRDVPSRIGFPSLLVQLADAWANRREEVERIGDSVAEELRRAARQQPVGGAAGPIAPATLLRNAVSDLAARFDEDNGGFNEGGPKFPPHHALRLLLTAMERGDRTEAPRLALATLDHMALGGIYDHVGGGFHRYATDAHWLVPHFEKMLYDNALLARAYAQAYAVTGRPAYARIARETIDWVLQTLQDPAGGFQSALDADSEGEEGKYYVFTYEEVRSRLGAAGPAFCETYNILPDGNWRDEATGRLTGTNIPHLAVGPAAGTNVALPDALTPEQRSALGRVRAARDRRIPPGKDDKVLTAWNGLMIGALAYAGKALNEPRYLDAARRAADFLLSTMRPNGQLLRRYARGSAAIPAYLDDFAYLLDGLFDIHDATGGERWRNAAAILADEMLDRFWDPEQAGFFFTGRGHEALIALTKDLFDGATPSPNGVAARVLARLGRLPDGDRFAERAREMLTAYRGLMERAPQGTPSLILAALDAFPDSAASAVAPATPAGSPAPASPVTLSPVTAAPVRLAPGERAEIVLALGIAAGYHVNAHEPAQDYLIPTVATVASDLPAIFGEIVYPAPVPHQVAGDTLAVYEDGARLTIPVAVTPGAPPGTYALTVTVRFQPCTDTECLPPGEATYTMSILVR